MRPLLRSLSVALLLMFGCSQESEKILYKGPDFVFLDSKTQITLYENQKTPLLIPIKVSLAQTNNTEVTYEVVGDNILANYDYKVQTPNPIEIARSKYAAEISIMPIDNNIIQPETRTLYVRIKSINNPNLSAQVVREVQIHFLEDDCPPTVPRVSLWVGKVNVQGGNSTVTGTAEGGTGGICGGSMVVTANLFGPTNPSTTMTIILIQNPDVPTKGIASVVRFKLFQGVDTYEYEASGTYDEAGKTITLNFTVYDITDPTFNLTGTHIITPQ